MLAFRKIYPIFKMKNKYFGTDGIRGTVNKGNITGEKFLSLV